MGTLLLVFFIVLLSKNIYRSVQTPTVLKRLRSYTEGPYSSTEITEEGTIVPVVNYFEEEKAREIFQKKYKKGSKKEKDREKRRKKREIKARNAVMQDDEYLESLVFLEMQMFQMDDVEGKLVPYIEDKSQEEIIIDEILSLPMDTLMTVKNVPDRLLSPITERPPARRMSSVASSRRMSSIASSRRMSSIASSRRMSSIASSRRMSEAYSAREDSVLDMIPLPLALCPPYLPSKPVSGILAPQHTTDRLYRYTHIERIVYPHQRVIVPPGFVS